MPSVSHMPCDDLGCFSNNARSEITIDLKLSNANIAAPIFEDWYWMNEDQTGSSQKRKKVLQNATCSLGHFLGASWVSIPRFKKIGPVWLAPFFSSTSWKAGFTCFYLQLVSTRPWNSSMVSAFSMQSPRILMIAGWCDSKETFFYMIQYDSLCCIGHM